MKEAKGRVRWFYGMQDSKATSGSSPYDTAADVSGLVGLPVLAANGVELGKVILALR